MRPKTRLDPVIKLEEKNEERRLHEMAAAGRQVKSAEESLSGAQHAARSDHRNGAKTATDWILAEIAHTRALHDVRAAEHQVQSATAAEGVSRVRYGQAHAKAEALRRVANARVEEILTARLKAETREMDDIGLLAFQKPRATRAT